MSRRAKKKTASSSQTTHQPLFVPSDDDAASDFSDASDSDGELTNIFGHDESSDSDRSQNNKNNKKTNKKKKKKTHLASQVQRHVNMFGADSDMDSDLDVSDPSSSDEDENSSEDDFEQLVASGTPQRQTFVPAKIVNIGSQNVPDNTKIVVKTSPPLQQQQQQHQQQQQQQQHLDIASVLKQLGLSARPLYLTALREHVAAFIYEQLQDGHLTADAADEMAVAAERQLKEFETAINTEYQSQRGIVAIHDARDNISAKLNHLRARIDILLKQQQQQQQQQQPAQSQEITRLRAELSEYRQQEAESVRRLEAIVTALEKLGMSSQSQSQQQSQSALKMAQQALITANQAQRSAAVNAVDVQAFVRNNANKIRQILMQQQQLKQQQQQQQQTPRATVLVQPVAKQRRHRQRFDEIVDASALDIIAALGALAK